MSLCISRRGVGRKESDRVEGERRDGNLAQTLISGFIRETEKMTKRTNFIQNLYPHLNRKRRKADDRAAVKR